MQGTDGLPRGSVEPGDVLASAAQENRLADVLELDPLLEPGLPAGGGGSPAVVTFDLQTAHGETSFGGGIL